MKTNFIYLGLAISLLYSCSGNSQLMEAGKTDLKEISGLQYLSQSNTLWALEDSGNKNKLYQIGANGKTVREVTVVNLKNNDWEDLATDANGDLYIGDFGNNDNDRKDLAIYRVALNDTDEATVTAKISFSYPDQTSFPPKKSERLYDCEAFFEYKGNFYLFTKNRSANFNGDFTIYRVPNKAGNHKAELLGKLNTCDVYKKCAVTGADISPDGTKAVLLTGDKIIMFTDFAGGNFADATMQSFNLGHVSQKEGISFKDNTTLFVADEKDKKTGGILYTVDLESLKTK